MMEPGEYCVYIEYEVPLRANVTVSGNSWFLYQLIVPSKRFDVITDVMKAADKVIRTAVTNDGKQHLLREGVGVSNYVRNLSIDLN